MPTKSMLNIFTRNPNAMLAFYRDQVGFSQSFRMPPDGPPEHVVLRLGDSELALSSDRAIASVGLEPTCGNPFELVVRCDDVDGETARLKAAGTTVLVEPYDHFTGHRRAYLADPDGNWLALVDVG